MNRWHFSIEMTFELKKNFIQELSAFLLALKMGLIRESVKSEIALSTGPWKDLI